MEQHVVAREHAARTIIVRCLLVVAATLVFAAAAARSADQLPVLLLYGFQPIPGFYAPQIWAEFCEHLSGRPLGDVERIRIDDTHDVYHYAPASEGNRDVFVGDYGMPLEPTVRDVRFYASRVAEEIEVIRARLETESIAVIAHSMGGLVARCYIESADFDALLDAEGYPDYGTVYRDDVELLITLATPHHGTEMVALGPRWAYSTLSRQIEPGSELLRQLNAGEAKDALSDATRYVSMGGQTCFGCGISRNETTCLAACVVEGLAWTGSDLVVMMQSTFLDGAENVACIGFDHVAMHANRLLIDSIIEILDGASAPEAVFSEPRLRDIAAAASSDS